MTIICELMKKKINDYITEIGEKILKKLEINNFLLLNKAFLISSISEFYYY